MSRGLGHIERQIQKTIIKQQARDIHCVLISSSHLAGDVFRPPYDWTTIWHSSRAQQLAVTRAMHSFVRKFPQFALMGGQGRKRLFLYDTTDPESVAWAKACVATKGFVPWCDRHRHIKK